jgi:hypothetical protein
MQAEPLLTWSKPITELVSFVALFLAAGAVGFRYAAARDRFAGQPAESAPVQTVYAQATQRAALLGLLGGLVQAVRLVFQLPHLAERAHLSVTQLITSDPQTIVKWALLLAAVTGFALAAGRRFAFSASCRRSRPSIPISSRPTVPPSGSAPSPPAPCPRSPTSAHAVAGQRLHRRGAGRLGGANGRLPPRCVPAASPSVPWLCSPSRP